MPATKSALSRYHLINACFLSRGKTYWSLHEILVKLEEHDITISRRTLEMDFEAMRFDNRLGYHAPIKYCKLNRGYHYTDPGYSINKINLEEEEIDTLLLARDLLEPYRNTSFLKDFQSIIFKIVSHTNAAMLSSKSTLIADIQCEKLFPDKVMEFAGTLLKAIRQRVVVEIFMENTSSEKENFFFHPYLLHEFRDQWYVSGIMERGKRKVLLHLERIDAVWLSRKIFT